jgi:metal-responsive CopG/Arc/MetJ family transcriptional regulator
METIKTTINIDAGLWRDFSIQVIKYEGYRKKNDVIEELIREYVEQKRSEKPNE